MFGEGLIGIATFLRSLEEFPAPRKWCLEDLWCLILTFVLMEDKSTLEIQCFDVTVDRLFLLKSKSVCLQ